MKKWFVGLLMMAMALVMIPSVVMAETEVSFYCPSCCEQRTGIKSDTYEYFDQNTHRQRITCKVCNYKGMSVSSAHTETKAATCQSAAYCADCKSYYGSKAEHNWGDWTTDEKTHKRTCQTPGCGAVDTGSHTSEPKATCKTAQTCAICNVQYKDKTNHEGERKTAYYYSESQHVLRIDCSYCGERISMDYEAHTETTAATCTTAAYCADCKNYYGDPDPDAHDLVQHAAQASTCGGMGWDAYETCSRCDYTTYVELPALGHDYQAEIIPRTCEDDGYTLHTCTRCADRYADTIVPHCGHWYGEWTANGDGTQRAECLRGGCHHEKTVDCEIIELPALNISLCPVCGTASDGSRLALTNASVKIVSGRIPHGEALLRVGTLANGEKLLTVGYVYGGQLSKASCQVKITLPAGLLEGHTLSLLAEDGTETELTDVQDGSFVLDFSGASSPVQVIRLVPQAE